MCLVSGKLIGIPCACIINSVEPADESRNVACLSFFAHLADSRRCIGLGTRFTCFKACTVGHCIFSTDQPDGNETLLLRLLE
jgi:hypothetical protein